MALAYSPFLISNNYLSYSFLKPSKPIQIPVFIRLTKSYILRSSSGKIRATIDEAKPELDTTLLVEKQDKPTKEVEESVKLLKSAAKTRKVSSDEILSAFTVLEKAKLDPSEFLATLGGTKSPGRTWMLVFTAEKSLKGGKYFPITAVQRFDAAVYGNQDLDLLSEESQLGKRIENGVYLGSLGCLTFEGRLSWKKRILAFTFERIRIKIGPFNPLDIQFGGKDKTEPSTKDPFFIWFYIDEEIAVARGRSGGTAFWVRCRKIPA